MAHQLPLRGIDIETLRRLFDQPEDDPMYYTYPVNSEVVNALLGYVEGQIELDKYDYFLDYSDES